MRLNEFLSLPLHHIDASVLIESEKTEDGRYCRKYLQRVGYEWRGKISSPVLGELFMRLLSMENYDDRIAFLMILDHLRRKRKVDYYAPIRMAK